MHCRKNNSIAKMYINVMNITDCPIERTKKEKNGIKKMIYDKKIREYLPKIDYELPQVGTNVRNLVAGIHYPHPAGRSQQIMGYN